MVLYTLSTIGDLAHIIIKYKNFPQRPHMDLEENISDAIVDALYFVGNIAFYILILLRIALPFQLNKFVSYLLGFIIFIFSITSVRYIVFLFKYKFGDLQWTWITITLSITDLILSVFILLIFICKMKKTIINIDPSLSKEAEQNVNLMANVITKHSVLFGIAIIINQGFYLSIFLYNTKLTSYHENITTQFVVLVGYCIPFGVRAIESIANVLILWLLLRINYDRYIGLCKCCHLCVGKCCFKNIDHKSRVNNPYRELSEDL